MNKLLKGSLFAALLAIVSQPAIKAQTTISTGGEVAVVTTAVPFLQISPDARSGAMGDVGLAMSPDANAIFVNPSKLAFMDNFATEEGGNQYGVALNYVPWLRALVNDIYIAGLSGYYTIDEDQAIAVGLRYFSLGEITFTNASGDITGQDKPNEFAVDLHYARELSENFSAGISLRYIYSNLAGGQVVNGLEVKAGNAAAADISFFYTSNEINMGEGNANFNVGVNISNIGSKISYTDNAVKDFIPTNLGVGFGFEMDLDEYNELNFYADFNKLLVPTPDTTDEDNNGVYDYREKSPIAGIFSSFGDAPGGFSEELSEFTVGVGAEYWYNKQFAVRFGYFYEHPNKGARQFLTAGLGIKYNVFGLNFSYLIPTSSQRNPLDNTLRFSLLFDFASAAE